MKKRKKKAVINTSLIEIICDLDRLVKAPGISNFVKSRNIASLVNCSTTSVTRILAAWTRTEYSTDWKVVLDKYRELNDEEQLIRMYKHEGEVMSTNVITIEKNVPIPNPITNGRGGSYKYNFLSDLEIGDSFVINGNMPDYTPKAVRCVVYEKCKELGMSVTIRTLEGRSDSPQKIRVWRTA
tara:strand:+ start:177 stop:725 length:549 start_codon:yes stop_codon:yes gene_type:complete